MEERNNDSKTETRISVKLVYLRTKVEQHFLLLLLFKMCSNAIDYYHTNTLMIHRIISIISLSVVFCRIFVVTLSQFFFLNLFFFCFIHVAVRRIHIFVLLEQIIWKINCACCLAPKRNGGVVPANIEF